MKDKKFCSPENFYVMVPYRDLEKLLEVANNMETFVSEVQQTRQECAAMRGMFLECMENIREVRNFVKD